MVVVEKMDKEKIQKVFKDKIDKIKKEDVQKAITNSNQIFEKIKEGQLREFASQLKTLVSMLKDYKNGQYNEISWSSIAIITAALLYILSPFDFIPDFVLGVGLADDAFVVSICLKLISNDIKEGRSYFE